MPTYQPTSTLAHLFELAYTMGQINQNSPWLSTTNELVTANLQPIYSSQPIPHPDHWLFSLTTSSQRLANVIARTINNQIQQGSHPLIPANTVPAIVHQPDGNYSVRLQIPIILQTPVILAWTPTLGELGPNAFMQLLDQLTASSNA